MSDEKQSQLFESVSALMDNQASPLELQRILAHTEKSTGVRARWHRYQLARSVMRGETRGVHSTDVADNVRAVIAKLDIDVSPEQTLATKAPVVEHQSTKKPTWYAPLGRVAIAASVSLVAVFGAQQFGFFTATTTNENPASLARTSDYLPTNLGASPGLSPQLNVQNVSISSASQPVENVSSSTTYDFQLQRQQRWEEEQVRQAIDRLMLEHAQQSALDQSTGLMPFIRVSDSAFTVESGR